jgi:hypothetical protein
MKYTIVTVTENQWLEEFDTMAEAEKYCVWWNEKGRFTVWGDPFAYIMICAD